MESHILAEVLECLRGERTIFTYYRDAYAAYLLRRVIADKSSVTLRELQHSRWSKLLKRPPIRDLMARCGDGYLRQVHLAEVWCESAEPFVLTVGAWGGARPDRWYQVSRPGCNLVLQLNLSNKWHQEFRAIVGEPANAYFGFCHPLSRSRAMTLAWARLDFDLRTSEVLVEEIQTDLVRDIGSMQREAHCALADKADHFYYYGNSINAIRFCRFAERFMHAFKKTWHEAMMAATVSFVFDELGVENLFYHTFETGNVLKNIHYRQPPRSLYCDLPEKFCFEETDSAPVFLQKDRHVRRKLKKSKDCRWFHMAA